MAAIYVSQLEQTIALNAAVTSSGTNSTSLDVQDYEGDLLLTVAARAGGTNTVTVAVHHSYNETTDFEAVPAAAILDIDGDVDTMDSVGATASNQTVILRKDLLRRYVRVILSGTSLSGHNFTVVFTAPRKYATIS